MIQRATIVTTLAIGLISVTFTPRASYGQIPQAFQTQQGDAEATTGLEASNIDTPTKPKTEKELRAEAKQARNEAELRVETDMQRMTNIAEALSKNLGQIHFLRTLCFGLDDQKWRNFANDMMKVEAADDPELQSQFIRAFNAGFYQEQSRHNQCTSKVPIDVAALAENSRNLATMLGDPYRQR
ncbi:MAG: TIGR02301 family protein [Litorimonas sp.]